MNICICDVIVTWQGRPCSRVNTVLRDIKDMRAGGGLKVWWSACVSWWSFGLSVPLGDTSHLTFARNFQWDCQWDRCVTANEPEFFSKTHESELSFVTDLTDISVGVKCSREHTRLFSNTQIYPNIYPNIPKYTKNNLKYPKHSQVCIPVQIRWLQTN